MHLLLDTHAFLWYYTGSNSLSLNAKSILDQPENDFFISIASLWEIAIKTSLGKLDLDTSLEVFFQDIFTKGFQVIPVEPAHILKSATIPFHHRDPFDRLLIGQALCENMAIITKDAFFEEYQSSGLQIIW